MKPSPLERDSCPSILKYSSARDEDLNSIILTIIHIIDKGLIRNMNSKYYFM